MRACRFPAIGEHESAHARVLGELAFMQRQGRRPPGPGARLCARPADWFHSHLLTMDAALAGWQKTTRHGGPATHAHRRKGHAPGAEVMPFGYKVAQDTLKQSFCENFGI